MVCKSCGHDNPEKNRYCGMCGARIAAASKPTKDAAELAARAAPASPRPSSRPSPSLSGPSFLGLNDEPDPTSTHYLLDVDEERGSHAGLLIATLVLLAIALAAFYYRRELSVRAGPLYAAVLQRANPQPSAPATPPPAQTDSAAATGSTPPPAASDTPPATGAIPASKTNSSAALADMKADAKPPEPDKPVPAAAEDATSEKPAAEPAKLARASRLKPVETVSPENDPLLKLAQKYIHGQGVRADCVTGMAYLRQAMKRPNYAAASQMGALYATGTCVPLNRVEAYRYFSSAMQMAPSNPYLGQERDKLYGQMTSAERRQADQQQ